MKNLTLFVELTNSTVTSGLDGGLGLKPLILWMYVVLQVPVFMCGF